MIVGDSFNYHARLNTSYQALFIHYQQLSCSLDMYRFDMIVDDSFLQFERAINSNDSDAESEKVKKTKTSRKLKL